MKTVYQDEIELKHYLDSMQVRYSDTEKKWSFVIEFQDNKNSFALLHRNIYNSPIAAIRDLPQVIKATNFPADDITISLECVYSLDLAIKINDVELSRFLYFKEPVKVDSEENRKG